MNSPLRKDNFTDVAQALDASSSPPLQSSPQQPVQSAPPQKEHPNPLKYNDATTVDGQKIELGRVSQANPLKK
jgi:hypothetical protein